MAPETGIRIELLPRVSSLAGDDLILVVDVSTNETAVITKAYFDSIWITPASLSQALIDYYTKQQTDLLLSEKANVSALANFYSKTETSNLLAVKSDITHRHSDYVTNTDLFLQLQKKSDVTHTHLGMATLNDLAVMAAKKADVDHTHDEYAKIADVAPKNHTHPQYVLETTFTAAMADKSNIGHLHDDRYYTETEVDTLLSGKAEKTHYHSQYLETQQFTDVIANYAYADHAHYDLASKTWVSGALDIKANLTHTHDEYATSVDLDAGLILKSDVGHTHPQYVVWDSLAISLDGKASVDHVHSAADVVYVPDNPSHYHLVHSNVQTALDELAARYRDAEKVEYQPKSIASWEALVIPEEVPATVAQALDIIVRNLGDSNSVIDGGIWDS